MFGVSFDTVEENRAFAEKLDFPYALLCDTTRAMGLAYGTCESAEDGYAKRYTYVVGADGRIEQALATKDPAAQAAELLASLA